MQTHSFPTLAVSEDSSGLFRGCEFLLSIVLAVESALLEPGGTATTPWSTAALIVVFRVNQKHFPCFRSSLWA